MTADFKDHFSKVAGNYALFRPVYPNELYEWLLPLCSIKNIAWDAGTGNGQVAVRLSDHFQKVIASDASREQILHVIHRPNIDYGIYPAENTPLPESEINLITIGQALHWFHFDTFWKEVVRVAAPSAVLACWTYTHPVFSNKAVMDVLQQFYADIYPYWPTERAYVEAHYDTIPFPFCMISSVTMEMHYSFSANTLLSYFRTWSSVQQYISRTGADPLCFYEKDLLNIWGNPEEQKACVFPLFAKAFRL